MEHKNAARAAQRQTLSFLRNLFAENGLRPINKLGQNFLIDLNLIDLILRRAELSRDDLALEVGSGTGSLTSRLAEQAGAVFSVEIDPSFHQLALQTVGDQDHVQLVHADVLKNKNQLNPDLLDQLEAHFLKFHCKQRKLVANLPYSVATPVISNFLISNIPFERMIVTVQLEIGEKLVASPSCKDYGALTVLVQSLADVELIRRLAPSVFWPKPKVHSAIVGIWPNAAKRAQVGDPLKFRNFLRDLYSHRRKNLRGALVGWPGGRRHKQDVDRILDDLQISGSVRAEALTVADHLRLCDVLG